MYGDFWIVDFEGHFRIAISLSMDAMNWEISWKAAWYNKLNSNKCLEKRFSGTFWHGYQTLWSVYLQAIKLCLHRPSRELLTTGSERTFHYVSMYR
jgi:hypothetical protein